MDVEEELLGHTTELMLAAVDGAEGVVAKLEFSTPSPQLCQGQVGVVPEWL